MQFSDSILDKVISSKQATLMSEFSPREMVEAILNDLSDREKEVIMLRYGLDLNGKKTLESIGQKFNITRERVRQIENSAVKKVKNQLLSNDNLETIEAVLNQTLEFFGGIMSEDMLIEELIARLGGSEESKTYLSFILTQLLKDKFHYLEETDEHKPSWKMSSVSFDDVKQVLDFFIKVIEQLKEPQTLEAIVSHLKENHSDNQHQAYFNEPMVNSFLKISKKIETNPFSEWGLSDWPSITLKRISDKVYLLLKKTNEPMHFNQIAEKINEWSFDHKKANPATIHNELILDDKYVLVGRGIYALKEWGYQPGVVADVIASILTTAGKPLTKDQIISEVLRKRMVKKSTIILALMNKDRFQKNPDNTYSLKNS